MQSDRRRIGIALGLIGHHTRRFPEVIAPLDRHHCPSHTGACKLPSTPLQLRIQGARHRLTLGLGLQFDLVLTGRLCDRLFGEAFFLGGWQDRSQEGDVLL